MESKQKTLPLTKVCSTCRKEKAVEDFSRDSTKTDGRDTICKVCRCAKRKASKNKAKATVPTAVMASTQTKICYKCGEEKPLSDFYKNSRTKDGYFACCKSCFTQHIQRKKNHMLQLEDEVKSLRKLNACLHKVSEFTDKELTDELKRRGYTGKLRYNKEVEL